MGRMHVYWVLLVTLTSSGGWSQQLEPEAFFLSSCVQRVQNNFALLNLLTEIPDSEYERKERTGCRDEMLQFTKAIKSGQTWAMQMLDASSKIPSGILMGNNFDIGMYEQCVGVHPQENVMNIQGRHCMYILNVPLSTLLPNLVNSSAEGLAMKEGKFSSTMKLVLSACVPSSCDGEDVLRIVNDSIAQFPSLKETGITVSQATCSRTGDRSWGPDGIAAVTFLLAVVLFIVACTICEVVKGNLGDREFKSLEILSKFSLYANAKKLLRTTSTQSLPFINGLRTLSMAWVIFGHLYFTIALTPLTNFTSGAKWLDMRFARMFTNASLSVDTFLVLSGCLLTNIFLKRMRQGETFNLSSYYIYRYVRLTPSAVVSIMFVLYIVDHLGSGAQWDLIVGYCVKSCQNSWWLNLFYVHNIQRLGTCGIQMWYLAVDMQLFWLSPIILYPLYRWPRIGLSILALSFVASIAVPAVIGFTNGYSSLMIRPDMSYPENMIQQQNAYIFLHMRAAPWLIGVYLGYLIVEKERKMNKVQLVVGWILATCAFVFCSFFFTGIHIKDYDYNVFWETFHLSMTRPIWAAGIAWIIFASTYGYGGLIAKFLSLPVFVPLSRISYSVYLVHFNIQLMRSASLASPSHFSHFETISLFWIDLTLSTVVGFIFCLFFEMPIMVLTEMFFADRSASKHTIASKKIQ